MKTRNPRVVAHEALLKLKAYSADADFTWANPPSLRYYADEPGGKERYHVEPRKRADIRPEEYPENDPTNWVHLARWARAIAIRADELEEFAREQAKVAVRKGIVIAEPEE